MALNQLEMLNVLRAHSDEDFGGFKYLNTDEDKTIECWHDCLVKLFTTVYPLSLGTPAAATLFNSLAKGMANGDLTGGIIFLAAWNAAVQTIAQGMIGQFFAPPDFIIVSSTAPIYTPLEFAIAPPDATPLIAATTISASCYAKARTGQAVAQSFFFGTIIQPWV